MGWAMTLGSFGVALGVGLMVGLERERASSKRDVDWFGGIRTFAVVGMIGALFGLIGQVAGGWFAALGIGLTCAVLFVPAVLEIRLGQRAGITSEVAGAVVLLLGVLATVPIGVTDDPERLRLVLAGGIAVMGLLTMRKPIHRLAGRVKKDDIYATAKLAVMLLIVLPILPDLGLGPSGRLNPFKIGMLVSLIAAIGFVGYLAVRVFGSQNGMALTGLLGGLVSSTAVTLNFSGRVKQQPELVQAAALGIILASSVMVPRVLVLCAVVSPSLVSAALLPVGSMGLVAFAMAGVLYAIHRRSPDAHTEVELENPFSLSEALKFGAVFVVVLVATGWLTETYGNGALYISAALSAATSVDALTLTVAELHADGLADSTAVTALLIGCIANTLVKVGLGMVLGGRRLGSRLLGVFVPMLAAGVIALVLTL